MMQNPEFGQVPQTLISRIEKRREYHEAQGQKTGGGYLNVWRELINAKDVLAKELGWEGYDPTKKVTDSRVMSLIREQRKAFRIGGDWAVSDEVKEALGVFTEKRAAYRRTKNKLSRYNAELGRWSVFSDYLEKGQWDDPVIDPWLQNEFRKKRPDALSIDVMRFVLNQRNQEVGNINHAPERQTRSFIDRLKSPFRKLREAPAVVAGAADLLKRDGRWDRAQILYAGVSLTSLTLAALVFSGRIQVPETYPFTATSSSNVAQVVVETPTLVPQQTPEPSKTPIPEDCPYYDAIALYQDWNPELVCKIAQVSSGNNPKAENKNADGSYGMGVLQINSEEMKKMDPEIDPEHLKVAIREDPAQGITWAHYGYKIRGYSALSACANGQIDCWYLESSQGLPLVPDTPSQYRDVITEAALEYGVPPRLLASLLSETSGFDPSVVSADRSVGIGLFQPETARELGINPLDPIASTGGAAKYLRQQFDRFGNWPDAVGAYHAGPSVVAENQGIPPDYQKTRRYVSSVIGGFSKNDQSP